MLRGIERITGLDVQGTDGELGKTEDGYVDREYWVVRYFLVNAGSWLKDRRVLLSTAAALETHWKRQVIVTDLQRERVRRSPALDSACPVTRTKEEEINRYFGWPVYWDISRFPEYPGETGTEYPEVSRPEYHGPSRIYYSRSPEEEDREAAEPATRCGDHVHLLRTGRILGYHIQATDGEIGHLHELLFDDETWAIRYLVVDTRTFLPGRKALLTPSHVLRVEADESRIYINVRRDVIRNSPEYDSDKVLDREFEERVYDYYSQHTY
jgi:hypothetical protein